MTKEQDPTAGELADFNLADDSLVEVDVDDIRGSGMESAIGATDVEQIPFMHDVAWTEYVMKHFKDDEIFDGYPTVDGLRRVATKLLGPIISSVSRVVQAPTSANGMHATVEHTVTFRWDDNWSLDDKRTFQDVADVCPMNTELPYVLHSAATAATKAEGRALRKALQLRRVLAAEEMMDTPKYNDDNKHLITDSQLCFIDKMCYDLKINAVSLLNSGKEKYKSVRDVPYNKAVEICHYLNQVQIKTKTLPENLSGYDPDWKKKAGVA